MFYLGHQDNIKTLNNFFLGLEYSCKYTYNEMSNQETEDVLSWRSGILDCDAKMGNETAGYYCTTFKIVAFGNTEESTFEL